MEHYFRKAGNSALTIQLCPGADHGLELPSFVAPDGAFHWPRKAPELFQSIDTFLSTYVR